MPKSSTPETRVQRALIFQGRGALGAYEAGVFQALYERLVKDDSERGTNNENLFDIVVGTSMGAVNAAILVNYVLWNKTWQGSAEKLLEFWKHVSTTSYVEKIPGFVQFWDYLRGVNPQIAAGEAARRYYSTAQFAATGVPNVFSPPGPEAETKYLDFRPTGFSYSTAPLAESIKRFVHFPLKTSSTLGQPRLLLTSVDIKEASPVRFDSYQCESKYGDPEQQIVLEYKEGIQLEHILASTSSWKSYVRLNSNIGLRYFWDGRLASTPLRQIIDAHRQYWQLQGTTIPDLELYIINLWPSNTADIPLDEVGKIDRLWDIILNDKSQYDEKVVETATDYISLARMLIDLALGAGIEMNNIQKILDKKTISTTHFGVARTYKNLLEGHFNIPKMIHLGRKEDADYVSELDYSDGTINQLIEKGHQTGIQSLLKLPARNIDIEIECGIEGRSVQRRPSDTEAKKVEESFGRALKKLHIGDKLNQLKEIGHFLEWCRESQRNPDEILSTIDNEVFKETVEYLKPHYSSYFLENMNKIAISRIKEQDLSLRLHYVKYDQQFTLEPIEMYIELSRIEDRVKAESFRLVFKTETQVNIRKFEALFTLDGVKTFSEDISAQVMLSISQVSFSNVPSPIEFPTLSWKEQFNVNDLYRFSVERNANIWIKDHMATEPLEVGVQYELMINISGKNLGLGAQDLDIIRNGKESRPPEITVSITGNGFEIPKRTKKLFLIEGVDSDPVGFTIKGEYPGNHRLKIYFYYKLNLLMILSTWLNVIRSTTKAIQFGEDPKYLQVDVVSSSDKGFESIGEIERSNHE